MLFHLFHSQEERKHLGGSDFLEFQYCRNAPDSGRGRPFPMPAVHWRQDSLYVRGDDLADFLSCCGAIFTGGIYANGKSGAVDPCGINYYSREKTKAVIRELREAKPDGWQILLNWLERAEEAGGFFILGI